MTPPYTKTDCIEWAGCRDKAGYGHRRYQGKTMLAHRVAWMQAYGPIPAGLCVLHKCDNPSCCNPLHLFLGTQLDNIKDCQSKGRISRKTRNAGAKQWKAKITLEDARRIKELKGSETLAVLGKRFGLSRQAVWDIQNGRNWRHA